MSQEQTAYSATDEVTSFLEKRTAWSRTKILLRKSPATARFGMIVITIYILVAIFAPWIAPYGEAEVFAQPYAPWGGEHLLGTDQIGRDIYSRMIYGARNTVGIALVTTIL
ncbi:MAG: ABC transporter permease, partial [Rhodobacteraceae bacterium]|nr:ABC transporter permease [Paracoccaceae bacterium]